MKKFRNLVLLVVALVTCASVATPAYSSNWSYGAKMGVYSRWDGTFGVGVAARHSFAENLRFEPSLLFLCRRGMSIDLSADLHMPIPLGAVSVYPLAGLSLNDPGKFGLGVNVGGGVDWALAQNLNGSFAVKYMLETQRYSRNPLVFNLGIGYSF